MTTPCRACGSTDRYPSGKCIPCTKKRVATYGSHKESVAANLERRALQHNNVWLYIWGQLNEHLADKSIA